MAAGGPPGDSQAMLRLLSRVYIWFFAVALAVKLIFHVPMVWAIAVTLILCAAVLLMKSGNRPKAQYVTPSAAWKCPYCFKRAKLGATACHHCGRSLLRPTEAE